MSGHQPACTSVESKGLVIDPSTKICSHVSSCELFPHISKPGFLRVWQINYCESEFTRCERYRLSSEGRSVPVTLLPNGQSLTALAPKK